MRDETPPKGHDPPLRPASTVVCLRAASDGFEALLVQRQAKLAFHGGAWVFPGGRVDKSDAAQAGCAVSEEPAARLAGVREAAEEAALMLSPGQLAPLSHWTTPPGRARRFATWFYVCALDGLEAIRVDGREITRHLWLSPHAALDAQRRGELELPPPTFVTLMWLAQQPSLAQATAGVARDRLERFVPRPCPVPGGEISLYHGDAGYADHDPGRPGPRHRLWMVDDGWRYERTPRYR